MKFRWLIIFLGSLMLSCGRGNLPRGILTKDKMVPLMIDQHLAEIIFNQRYAIGISGENVMDDLYLSILKKHGVEQKIFEESVYYYSKHPDKYKAIYDEVLNRLNEMDIKVKLEDPTLKRK